MVEWVLMSLIQWLPVSVDDYVPLKDLFTKSVNLIILFHIWTVLKQISYHGKSTEI